MLQANPALTPNAVKAILQYTAEQHSGYNALTQGAGFLNTLGAVRLARFFAAAQPGDRLSAAGGRGARRSSGATTACRAASSTPPQRLGHQRRLGRGQTRARRATTSSGARPARRVRQHHLGHLGGDNVIWGTAGDDNIIWGTCVRRRQHHLGHRANAARTSSGAPTAAAPTATTSSGARKPAATTSSGVRRRRRQHHLGHCGRRQHHLGHCRRRRRQHHLGHRRRDNIIWGTAAISALSLEATSYPVLLWDYYYAIYSQYLAWLTDEQFFDLIDGLSSMINPWRRSATNAG